MSIKIIKNEDYLPHEAIILTRQDSLFDFRFDKIISAYTDRINKKLECPIWEVEVHPVDFCYLGCKGCSYAKRHNSNKINVEDLVKILKYYEQYDLKTVFFSGGGDPCGWKEWEYFINLMGDRKWKLGISTNLFELSNIYNIIDEFDFYQIHIVGYDKESVLAESGVDVFENLKSNYDNLMKRKSSQFLTMKILLRNENYKNISHFLDFIKQYECDSIVIKLEQNFTNNKKINENINLQTVRKMILSHSIISQFDYFIDNLEDIVFNYPIPKHCYIANSGLYSLIRADGSIFPCVAGTYNKNNSYGYIDKMDEYNCNKVKDGFYDEIMRKKICPLGACRHYRFNSIIERYEKGEIFSNLDNIPKLL